jgi:hypothetical protein
MALISLKVPPSFNKTQWATHSKHPANNRKQEQVSPLLLFVPRTGTLKYLRLVPPLFPHITNAIFFYGTR